MAADIKTKVTKSSPAAFLKAIEDPQRRKDCQEIAKMMADVTGEPAKMWGESMVGFDEYHYKYATGREGTMLLTGFRPGSANLTLYLGPGLQDKALMAKLGKHKMGKGCLYLKKLDDVDRKILKDLITKSVAEMRKLYPR
jgi:hypothetical protein